MNGDQDSGRAQVFDKNTSKNALDSVSALFEPYLQTREHATSIRKHIAEHLESLAQSVSDASPIIPNHVQGIRRQYLEAIHKNRQAGWRLATLQNSVRNSDMKLDDRTSKQALTSHLEVSRLHKQHQRFDIMCRYTSETDSIAEEHQIFKPHASRTISKVSSEERDQISSHLMEKVLRLIEELETALIHADHRLQHERQSLAELKSQAPATSRSANKLHALLATRSELTTWIETSLAKCDIQDNAKTIPILENGSEVQDGDIDLQYEKYTAARSMILSIISAVHQPFTELVGDHMIVPLQHVHSAAALPQLTSTLFPHVTQQVIASQYEAHIAALAIGERQQLTEELGRLKDESHLLLSYPVLGRPRIRRHSTTTADAIFTEDEDVPQLLKAWSFAKDGAATSTAAVVDKQCEQGEVNLNRATDILEALRAQDRIWRSINITS